MRERIKDRDRLSHIIEAIDNILEFMDGKTENDLATDKLLFFGVVKNSIMRSSLRMYKRKECRRWNLP